jgi:MGT family glycosyltransferase
VAKFVFISIPLRSHANPTFPVVQELVARGHEVIYYLTDTFKDVIEATGATFRRYESRIDQINKIATTTGKPVGLPMYMLDESLFVIPQILSEIEAEQPDCLVYETMCLSGRLVAEIAHIPAVNFRIMVAFTKRLVHLFQANTLQDQTGIEMFQTAMNQIHSRYGVRSFDIVDIFTHEEALNIVTFPRAFQIDGDSFGEHYCFVGSSIAPRNEQVAFPFEQLEDQPVLYISHGTVFNDRPDFFNLCFAAFADTPWKVVMSIGTNVDRKKLAPTPANFLVQSYVPQLEVLTYAKVCVTHGSMTTLIEAFAQGVPLVVIPQATSDVTVNARRVDELGLGVMIEEKSLTAELLRNAVLRVSSDPAFYTHALQMKEEIHASGGYVRAADVLQEFVKARVQQ